MSGWLRSVDPGDVEIWVRINPGRLREPDVRAVADCAALTGLCVAKTQTPGELGELDRLLTTLVSGAALVPLLESARAVLSAAKIAGSPRVARLQVGEADLRAELGVEPGADERELLWVRSYVVLASAAAGIDPPVAPVHTDFRDLAGLGASTAALKRLGYRGRACIHPAQVDVVNEVFTPAPDDIARARSLVARFEAAVASGAGVITDEAGRMVDEAVIRQARRLLAMARE